MVTAQVCELPAETAVAVAAETGCTGVAEKAAAAIRIRIVHHHRNHRMSRALAFMVHPLLHARREKSNSNVVDVEHGEGRRVKPVAGVNKRWNLNCVVAARRAALNDIRRGVRF